MRLLRSRLGRHGLRHGVAMSLEHIAVVSQLEPTCVVDVGANKGQFSLLCRELFPEVPIVAYEPLTRPSGIFENLFSGDSQVELHRVAIGAMNAIVDMHVAASDDSSSVLPIGELQASLWPDTNEIGREQVSMRPLSETLSGTNIGSAPLLKVDVQGYEYEVLAGAEDLAVFRWLLVEVSFSELYEGQHLFKDVAELAAAHGFALSLLYSPTIDRGGVVVQADALFIRG